MKNFIYKFTYILILLNTFYLSSQAQDADNLSIAYSYDNFKKTGPDGKFELESPERKLSILNTALEKVVENLSIYDANSRKGLTELKDRILKEETEIIRNIKSNEFSASDWLDFELDFRDRMSKNVARFNNVHVSVSALSPSLDLGFRIKEIKGKFYAVKGVYGSFPKNWASLFTNPERLTTFFSGTTFEVRSIDSEPIAEAIKQILPYRSASKLQTRRKYATFALTQRNFLYPKKPTAMVEFVNSVTGEKHLIEFPWLVVNTPELATDIKLNNITKIAYLKFASMGLQRAIYESIEGINFQFDNGTKWAFEKYDRPVTLQEHPANSIQTISALEAFDLSGKKTMDHKLLRNKEIVFGYHSYSWANFDSSYFAAISPSIKVELPPATGNFMQFASYLAFVPNSPEEESNYIVIDMRGQQGGTIGYAAHVLSTIYHDEPITIEHRSFKDLNKVSYSVTPKQYESMWVEENGFKLIREKPIYVLIDEACVSMCETFVEVLSLINKVTLIGRKTGGARSIVEFVQLNKDLKLTVPSESIYLSQSGKSRRIKDNESVTPDIFYTETKMDIENPEGYLELINNHYLQNF